MGTSSTKAHSRSNIYHEYERALKVTRNEQSKAEFKAMQWKKFLKKKLADPAYCGTPNWDLFRKPIEKWVNKETYEIDPCWLGHAQFFAHHSSSKTHIKRNLSLSPPDIKKNENMGVVRSFTDKKNHSMSPVSSSLKLNASTSDKTPETHSRTQTMFSPVKKSTFSRRGKEESTLGSEVLDDQFLELPTLVPSMDLESTKSNCRDSQQIFFPAIITTHAAEEFKKFLRKELTLKDHPINELIRIFKHSYEQNIAKSKTFDHHHRSAASTSEETEKIMNETLVPVKTILKLLREFTNLIYKEVINTYRRELDEEDENHNNIIDQLISQLLFDDTNSLLYQHIVACLQEKYKEQIEYFSKLAKIHGEKCLHEIDNQFKQKLMLLDSQVPYETVIRTLYLLEKIPNPYMKKDYISTMEREMVDSILNEMSKKGHYEEINLEPDDKFTIYTFCLMKSGYANVVVDIAFIEEFTLPEETNQAYARFKGCLMDYILSGTFSQFMVKEEEIRLRKGNLKSKRKCSCQTEDLNQGSKSRA